MAGEVLLLTKLNDRSMWTFKIEDDILRSLQITYSLTVHKIERVDRDTYVVKMEKSDVINTDVFHVQRVPLLEIADHL